MGAVALQNWKIEINSLAVIGEQQPAGCRDVQDATGLIEDRLHLGLGSYGDCKFAAGGNAENLKGHLS
eukprot:5087611-Alexandrium_andersonii.AAC.1